VAGLVVAMTWVLKRQSTQIDRSIRSLTQAVESFKRFEISEVKAHADIVAGMRALGVTQQRVLEVQERILGKLEHPAA
jgi:hypothetical protein